MIQQHKDVLRDFASTEAKNQLAREHRKWSFHCELICRRSALCSRSRGRQLPTTTAAEGFCSETKWTLNHRGSLATESHPAPAHLHLPLPPPLALAACQLPSASPLWCSGRNFTAAVSLLFVHAHENTRRHIRKSAHNALRHEHTGLKLAQKPPNKQAGRTATRAVGKRCHSVSISAN